MCMPRCKDSVDKRVAGFTAMPYVVNNDQRREQYHDTGRVQYLEGKLGQVMG